MGMGPLRASLKRKAAAIGGGLELVWLPANQAWAVFWHGQRVAGPLNHEREVEEFLSRYNDMPRYESSGRSRKSAGRSRRRATSKKRRTLKQLRRATVKVRGYGALRHTRAVEQPSKDPKYYLSKSEGRWRVIHGGVPIMADTDEESARRAARFLNVDLTHGWIWNGDRGQWERRR